MGFSAKQYIGITVIALAAAFVAIAIKNRVEIPLIDPGVRPPASPPAPPRS